MRAWTYGGSRLKKLGTICFLEKVELCSYNYHFFLDLVEFWQYSNSAPQRFLVAYDYGIQVSVDFSFHVCRKESETWYARYILEGMDSSTRYGCRPSLEDYRVEDYRMSYWYSWHECGLVPPGSLLCDFLTVLCAPPAPMNHVKLYKGCPPRDAPSKLLQLWYKTFPTDQRGQVEMKNPTRLSNKTSTAWSCAKDQILENTNLRNMFINSCTER